MIVQNVTTTIINYNLFAQEILLSQSSPSSSAYISDLSLYYKSSKPFTFSKMYDNFLIMTQKQLS